MIPIPNDYDSARSFGSAQPQLTPGGHICVIQGARMEKSRTGKDMLVVAFDIQEGSEFDGYFRERFARAYQFNSAAKWPGVFRVLILNGQGQTNGFFKGLIEALEASNAGYDFKATGGDEARMKGLTVGFNFGEEEYEYSDRKTGAPSVGVSCRPAYAVSVERVREGIVPPPRKTLETTGLTPPPAPGGFTEAPDEALPF